MRDVVGDLQLENINGPITATNITGSVIAESVNNADHRRAGRGGCTACRDLTVFTEWRRHADAAGELRRPSCISTARSGEIVSDFELDMKPSKPLIERNEGRGGVSVRMEDVIVATVNGGGPVVRVKTLNGSIKIEKARRLKKSSAPPRSTSPRCPSLCRRPEKGSGMRR